MRHPKRARKAFNACLIALGPSCPAVKVRVQETEPVTVVNLHVLSDPGCPLQSILVFQPTGRRI
jgi:hypothetical protein